MSRVILFALLTITSIYARDWGFSKDTVYGWKAGSDTAFLINQGTDTLKIDTLRQEILKPSDLIYSRGSFYFQPPLNSYASFNQSVGKIIPMPPGGKDTLLNFNVDQVALAKSVSTEALGDTIVARLIFEASLNRGRDTLIYKGIQKISSGLSPRRYFEERLRNRSLFDPQGRKQTPPITPFFWSIPLLSPGN